MKWYITSIVFFAAALVLLVWVRVRDSRYIKKKTSETMNSDLWQEVKEEEKAVHERSEKFKQALKDASEKR